MKRKVQQLGSSTLAVSVPAEWARQHEIEKGDEILIQRDESGGSLLLVPPDPSMTDTEVTIDARELSADTLERAIVTQYVLGRQLIHIESEDLIDTDQRDAVLDAQRRLMGLGIIEEGTSEITVRCSVAPTDFDLPTLLGRLWRTEATIRQRALDSLIAGEERDVEKTDAHRMQMEKLFYLFLRILFATYQNPRLNHTVGLATGFPLIGFRSAAQDIRLMADIADQLSSLGVEGDAPPSEAVDRLAAINEALDEATELIQSALVSPDYQTTTQARTALTAATDAVDDAQAYLESERPEPLLKLHQAVVLLDRSIRHAGDSLEVATHLLFREDLNLVNQPEATDS